MSPTMTDKSISEQMREYGKLIEDDHIRGDLADKVEALERSSRGMHKLITTLEERCLENCDNCLYCDNSHDLIQDWRNDDHRGN